MSSSLLEEIKFAFANLPVDRYKEIIVGESETAWVFRDDHKYGAGIEVKPELEFIESFASARMYTRSEILDDRRIHLLILENSVKELRNEFASLCAQFVEPGEHGTQRKALEETPEVWWKKWRKLLGNSVREKNTHGVVGELLVYELLLEQGDKPKWYGPSFGSHDFELDSIDYEVKSTLARYGHTVTVSGQNQLELAPGKKLSLLFCRFEEATNGYCIDDLVRNLVRLGVSSSELEDGLSKLGFPKGSVARREHFQLHDVIREYAIDSSFPRITNKSFKDEKFPPGIVQLTYRIDLTSHEYDVFCESVIT